VGVAGKGGGRFEAAEELAEAIEQKWPADSGQHGSGLGKRFVVCTGGEPLLQLDAKLIAALHGRDFEIAVESNGTIAAPQGVDWLCVSPKAGAGLKQHSGDELKLVFPQLGVDPSEFESLAFRHFFLQPMDGPSREAYTELALRYCLDHPQWRLSLQTHKILGIP
jgi:7-carboxy-7-deazaguanine synthase (Cx14CxxC type)